MLRRWAFNALKLSPAPRDATRQGSRRFLSSKGAEGQSDEAAQAARNQRVSEQFKSLSEKEREAVLEYLERKTHQKELQERTTGSGGKRLTLLSVFGFVLLMTGATSFLLGLSNRQGVVVKGRVVKVDPDTNAVTYRYRAFGHLFEKVQRPHLIPFGPTQKPYEKDQIVEIHCLPNNPRYSVLDPPYFYIPASEIGTIVLEDSNLPSN